MGPTPPVTPYRVAGGGGPSPVTSMLEMLSDLVIPSSGGPHNSAPNSLDPRSLVTDANSASSGDGRPAESYSRQLPASPLLFLSNSVMDGSTVMHQELVQQTRAGPDATSGDLQKMPELMTRQDDIFQPQVMQQLMQRPDSLLLRRHQNPQLQALIQQQHGLSQQQQMLQSQMQWGPIRVQQHPQEQHPMQPMPIVRRPLEGGICAQRLMQYMYHQRHRPDNSILYWRKFVAEYYAPRAKKRRCLSVYANVGDIFPQMTVDAWHCDLCGSKSVKGFDTAFEVLPRLYQTKFDSGVIDELLFLDMPRERRLSSVIMVLECEKAVQESVYEHIRVVRDGRLRIFFTADLKILTWEFCERHYEEFLSRRFVAPQVNELLQVAQRYQASVTESGSSGVSHQDMQDSCNMFATTGHQLARKLELQSLGDLGFSKRYVRCLQISEVANCMKDLIAFNEEHNMRPIESLKNYTQWVAAKFQAQKMQVEQLVTARSLPAADENNLNNSAAIGVTALNNHHNLIRNSASPNQNSLQPDSPHNYINPNRAQPSILTNSSFNGLLNPQQNNLQSSEVNQSLQQQVIQQLLREVRNNKETLQQSLGSLLNVNVSMAAGKVFNGGGGGGIEGFPVWVNAEPVRNGLAVENLAANLSNNYTMGTTPSRAYSFKSGAINPTISDNSLNNMHLPEFDSDISQELGENGMFGGEPGDVGFGWKVGKEDMDIL